MRWRNRPDLAVRAGPLRLHRQHLIACLRSNIIYPFLLVLVSRARPPFLLYWDGKNIKEEKVVWLARLACPVTQVQHYKLATTSTIHKPSQATLDQRITCLQTAVQISQIPNDVTK